MPDKIRSCFIVLAVLIFISTATLADASAPLQTVTQQLEGPWSGTLSTDGPSGDMALTIIRQGTTWQVKIRMVIDGDEISNDATQVIIVENAISFKTIIMGAETRFSGRLDNEKLKGRLQALQNGQVVGTGTWNVKPGAAEPVAPPKPYMINVKSPMIIDYLTISSTQIVFAFNGDLWHVPHRGGEARQITKTDDYEDFPVLSPDGQWLAFSRQTGGNHDVYIMPSAGGDARRLTYYPKEDYPVGWTPDSEDILFNSGRDGDALNKLFTIHRDGGFPARLPLPKAYQGSFAPDGNRFAYLPRPFTMSVNNWRYYRGGLTTPLWIVNFDDLEIQEVTDETANARFPMWVDDRIYYLSDQTGTFNLNVYDTKSNTSQPLTSFKTYGIEYAAAAGENIAFFRNGAIHLFDATSGQVSTVPVTLTVEAPDRQERTARARNWIQSASITADGNRVLFGARGDVLLFDPSNDEAQNTTRTASVAEHYPVMSPSGSWIAYMSDASGEYKLHLRPAGTESGEIKTFSLEEHPSFYRELTWSPDGRYLAYSDARLALWTINVQSGETHRVARSTYIAQGEYHPNWSPDGRWLTYAKALDTSLRAAFLYDTATQQTYQITDGLTHVEYPVFDRNGLYLYFVSSTNAIRAAASDINWGLLSTLYARPLITRTLHLFVLRGDTPAPFLPNGKVHPGALPLHESHVVQIDLEGIGDRIIQLPVRAADFSGLAAGPPGILYVNKTTWPETPGNFGPTKSPLFKIDLANPAQQDTLSENISEFSVSYGGRNMLYRFRNNWVLAPIDSLLKKKIDPLNTAEIRIELYPMQEWTQMYYEAWRKMRDYFYDPNYHGQDLNTLEAHYAAYLPYLSSRSQLNQLFRKMLGHISVSHMSIGGGDSQRRVSRAERVGVIGADFEIDQGKYRFSKIIHSGHFSSTNALWKAPLDQPGIHVNEGEYLLAVDGVSVTDSSNVYALFEGKVDVPVELTIATDPAGTQSRSVSVIPLIGVGSLRLQNWAMAKARKVEELSGGRLGYVYISGYGGAGLEAFYRGLMGMSDKEGLIIDQRYNGGGITSDALIEALNRQPLYYYAYRHGNDFPTPPVTFPGPKVLIINEGNFSAAETFALMFKLGDVGTIIGKRTGGGGIGTALFQPPLIDGGRINIPNRAGFNPAGSWDIENYGITPHIEVDILPRDWEAGRDPQLEKAVDAALEAIRNQDKRERIRPAYPVHP